MHAGDSKIVAGSTIYSPYGQGGAGGSPYFPGTGYYGSTASNEVWELDPVTPAFTDRSAPLDVPTARTGHCMAYNPATGKTYIYGGSDMMGQTLDDMWEWDGKVWAQVAADVRPPARADAAIAYDPQRKSLILFGGTGSYGQTVYGDTWEWNSTSRKWAQLQPAASPDPLYTHGMVTDTIRNKILLFGGMTSYYLYGPGPVPPPYMNPIRNEIWEWDGGKITWTNRTPAASSATPMARSVPDPCLR